MLRRVISIRWTSHATYHAGDVHPLSDKEASQPEVGCRLGQLPNHRPTAAELGGTYGTSDARARGAQLVLGADGLFSFSNWPPGSGNGRWETQNDFGRWQIEFTGSARASNADVVGDSVPFTLELYISDPDEGPIVMRRIK
jgi:hypothetical protein